MRGRGLNNLVTDSVVPTVTVKINTTQTFSTIQILINVEVLL